MSQQTFQPPVESLFVLTAETTIVKSISGTPLGDRTIVDVVSGTFAGPRLSGRIPATGGDWLVRTPRGSHLDVRLLLETDDGVTILFRYAGRASQVNGQTRIEVTGSFDAPDGPYAWLNDIQTFGLGVPSATGVQYHFFCFG